MPGIRIPEKAKRAGVAYAATSTGVELPVVDVSHPAFRVDVGEAELAGLVGQFIHEARKRERAPAFVQRLFFRVFLRGSILARGLREAEGGFLDSLSTYLFKLGPDNLGEGWAGAIDRKIAASLPALALRLRLQDMAHLLADGLAPLLRADSLSPLHLLNIGGGAALDSLNALVLLRQGRPRLREGRRAVLTVLDLKTEGPAFGARALDALQADGAALDGVDVRFEHLPYDWADTGTLRELLARPELRDAVLAVSSEGGLFEYGSDEEIVANLEALAAGTREGTPFVGSVTRGDGPAEYLHRGLSRAAVRPRTLDKFRELAHRGGWSVTRAIERPFSYNVSLTRDRR